MDGATETGCSQNPNLLVSSHIFLIKHVNPCPLPLSRQPQDLDGIRLINQPIHRFYATPNKECRFTAEECRDLHEFYTSTPGDSLNLRMGKPTWGAAADLSPPSSDECVPDPKGREKTCWYWANATCEYSADSCRFLHKRVLAGVMPKPGDKKDSWKRGRNNAASGGWGEDNTDLIDQDVVESAWLQSPTEKYKPPHVKALEEKEQLKSAGWW